MSVAGHARGSCNMKGLAEKARRAILKDTLHARGWQRCRQVVYKLSSDPEVALVIAVQGMSPYTGRVGAYVCGSWRAEHAIVHPGKTWPPGVLSECSLAVSAFEVEMTNLAFKRAPPYQDDDGAWIFPEGCQMSGWGIGDDEDDPFVHVNVDALTKAIVDSVVPLADRLLSRVSDPEGLLSLVVGALRESEVHRSGIKPKPKFPGSIYYWVPGEADIVERAAVMLSLLDRGDEARRLLEVRKRHLVQEHVAQFVFGE